MKNAKCGCDGSSELLPLNDHPIPVGVSPGQGYTIHIEFSDGNSGDVDLSEWVGRGIFRRWKNREFFESVHIDDRKAVAWGDQDDMDVCADTIYMMLTGTSVDELFPRLQGLMQEDYIL